MRMSNRPLGPAWAEETASGFLGTKCPPRLVRLHCTSLLYNLEWRWAGGSWGVLQVSPASCREAALGWALGVRGGGQGLIQSFGQLAQGWGLFARTVLWTGARAPGFGRWHQLGQCLHILVC